MVDATSTAAPPRAAVTAAPSAPTSSPSVGAARVRAEVVRVTDGDTIRVRIEGREYAVRYIGIDTPETVDPRQDVQCFGREASAFNTQLVAGRVVELEKDVSETDQFGRLLRYVHVDGAMVNEQLVRQGYARASSYPPDVRHEGRFRTLESEARASGAGLWAPGACAAASSPTPAPVPSPTTSPTAAPRTAAPANCDPAYPTVCIPPPPPDLDCGDVPYRRFQVLPPDPHRFDGNDNDGLGCES
jgi:micrococcal nuclease